MSWLSKIAGRLQDRRTENMPATNSVRASAGPQMPFWREANETPFGVPVLDLTPVMENLTAWSGDPTKAEKCISWSRTDGAELDEGDLRKYPPLICSLSYTAAPTLPDGLLFTPSCMEEKWVIAYRRGTILFARSWTGDVQILAEAEHVGQALHVTRLWRSPDSVLDRFGDIVPTVDWMIRSHALDQVIPWSVSAQGSIALEQNPNLAFNLFGRKALYAANHWSQIPPSRPLRSDGALFLAVRNGDSAKIRDLVRAGEAVDAPTTLNGYTPLMVALARRDANVIHELLLLGANANARADRGMTPLGIGIIHSAAIDVLDDLIARGADPKAVNDDGFGMLHAAAESGNAEIIPWLVQFDMDLEARTGRGHTALQIASALGWSSVVKALLDVRVDIQASSPSGTAREIARSEGKMEIVELLDRHSVDKAQS